MAEIYPSIKSRQQQHLMVRRFGEDVANRMSNRPGSPPLLLRGTPDTLKAAPTRRTFRTSATRSSSCPPPRSSAVPFPSIHEEDSEGDDSTDDSNNSYSAIVLDSTAEEARGQEWATELARRQASIKELRDRKLRLEQTHSTTRARKSTPGRYSYLTSPERKFSAEDVEFLSALHASVVWRLWHVDLSPDVFASERHLATRLHLVLMRFGKQNIPVPPIVSLSMSHHLVHSKALQARNMIEKDRPGIQSLPQLVAKSLLRQGKPRKSLAAKKAAADRAELQLQQQASTAAAFPSSPLGKRTISPDV